MSFDAGALLRPIILQREIVHISAPCGLFSEVLAVLPEGHANVHELCIVAENVPRGVKL